MGGRARRGSAPPPAGQEQDGPEAVPEPEEIVEAVGDPDVVTAHFARFPRQCSRRGQI